MINSNAYVKMLGSIAMSFHNPTLVSVGANDGITADRVIPFCVKNKWKSLLIEPLPHIMKKCKDNVITRLGGRENVFFHQGAVSSRKGEIEIRYLDPTIPLNSCEKSIFMGQATASDTYKMPIRFHEYVRNITVPCATLDEIISSKFNYATVVSIDVEGYEKEVFSGFDIERWKPLAVIWEVKHLNADQRRPIMRRMSKMGYKHVKFGPDCVSARIGLEKLIHGS